MVNCAILQNYLISILFITTIKANAVVYVAEFLYEGNIFWKLESWNKT